MNAKVMNLYKDYGRRRHSDSTVASSVARKVIENARNNYYISNLIEFGLPNVQEDSTVAIYDRYQQNLLQKQRRYSESTVASSFALKMIENARLNDNTWSFNNFELNDDFFLPIIDEDSASNFNKANNELFTKGKTSEMIKKQSQFLSLLFQKKEIQISFSTTQNCVSTTNLY